MFKGSITALITPFKDGAIDWDSFDKLVEWQIEQGSHGLVPCGTTGESPTLSHDDHKAIIRRCVQVVNKRIPVIAGTGSNATQEAIELTQDAKDAGVDGCLSVVPYYNKPTQDGMIAHFSAIHDAVDLPIILYDIPGRSVVQMDLDTIATLAKMDHIVGIKDATNDLSRVCALREVVPADFALLSGEDPTAAGFYALGGNGCISVVSNIAPKACAELYNSWTAKDIDTFAARRDALAPLGRDLFCESSPAPVKYAAQLLGLCTDEVRLPLLPATPAAQEKVKAAMKHAGLI
ncbi:MAG TPA: 4-hydroxy-tetrahydrodipicolinate synthase [Rhodospirillaceae bacterium]|nr:4-hydroxy-tetrahydrodipicolinate synthase [Rhodospirillaceae bacterium]